MQTLDYIVRRPNKTNQFQSLCCTFLDLRFIYGGQCDVDGSSVLRLLYVAKQYDIPDLVGRCKTYLQVNIDSSNACSLLDQTLIFEEKDLKLKCLRVISENTGNVLKSKAFLELSKNGLTAVLDLDVMDIPGEEEVYKACKNWAASMCISPGQDKKDTFNLRSSLAEILPLIRFPTMSIEIFSSVVAREEILTDKEKVLIIRDIVNKENVSGFRTCRRSKPYKQREPRSSSNERMRRLCEVNRAWSVDTCQW